MPSPCDEQSGGHAGLPATTKRDLMLRRLAIAATIPALLMSATPAQAISNKSWSKISDVGAGLLGVTAVGVPAFGDDTPGAFQAGGSIIVGFGIAEGLKQVVHEQRPDGSGNDSFPSGHTAFSFAAAASMQRRYGWEVGLPATLVATLVGVARVKADKHHWYDVVAGAAIGEASGVLITHPFDDRVNFFPWGDSKGGGVSASLKF